MLNKLKRDRQAAGFEWLTHCEGACSSSVWACECSGPCCELVCELACCSHNSLQTLGFGGCLEAAVYVTFAFDLVLNHNRKATQLSPKAAFHA